MYAFIFYGTYRALNYTIITKGKEKQEDRRISTVAQTSVIMILHMFTILGILKNKFDVPIFLLEKRPNHELEAIIIVFIFWTFNHFRYARRLKILSEKYKPIYDEHKYLDRIVGYGSFIISFALCCVVLFS